MPCLSESISDLVSRAEANEIGGFVGGKGGGVDAEDLFDFMAVAGLDLSDEGWIGMQVFETPCIYKDNDCSDDSVVNLDEISEFCKRSSHRRDIVHENMGLSGSDETFKVRSGRHSLHGVGTRVEYAADLHDICVCLTLS